MSWPGRFGEGARGRLARACLWTGLVPVVALTVLAAATLAVAVPLPRWVAYAPLLVGGVLVGLPHGAVDWAALPLAWRGSLELDGVLVVGVLYLALGAAYLGAWLVAPVPAAVVFLLLTWFHWGQGDRHALQTLYGAASHDALQGWLTILVRGGLPMVVPLMAFPATYRRVVATFVVPFSGALDPAVLFVPTVRIALGGGLAVATVVTITRAWRLAPDSTVWWLDVGETLGLWLFFATVPPVLAVGVYFVCWHSVRHVTRVLLLDGPAVAALTRGSWRVALWRFAVAALLPTLGALVLLAGLWAVVSARPTTLPGVAGLGLVGVAVLTLPHVVVVTLMDRFESGATRSG